MTQLSLYYPPNATNVNLSAIPALFCLSERNNPLQLPRGLQQYQSENSYGRNENIELISNCSNGLYRAAWAELWAIR